MSKDCIVISGAREHNLQNITVRIPRDKLTVTRLKATLKSDRAAVKADRKAMLLRLYNTGDTAAQATLKWNAVTPKHISLSDLSGLPGGRAIGALEMAPYEVLTLRADLK